MTADEDPALFDWFCMALDADIFYRALAAAALMANGEQYAILRPALVAMERQWVADTLKEARACLLSETLPSS